VSGKLTEEWRSSNDVPEDSWQELTVMDVAKVLDPNPSHRYPKADKKGVPILSTQQFVGDSGWTTDRAKLVNRDFFEERSSKCGFFEKDIIFARKGRLGLPRFAPTGFDYVYSHTVFIIRSNDLISPEFLLMILRPDAVVENLLMIMNSNTGVPTLGKGVFETMNILVPTMEEQDYVVQRVEQFFTFADQIEQRVRVAQSRINNLTQSILAKAFRGELVPQDPNDEPASLLLERIKQEREVAAKLAKAVKKVGKKKVKA
jgi:type I restriction enzyme S subunit